MSTFLEMSRANRHKEISTADTWQGNDERFVSGIDTRGSAAQCYFTATGAATNACTTTVFAECSWSLKIYAGKVLEIVQ